MHAGHDATVSHAGGPNTGSHPDSAAGDALATLVR